MGYSTVAEVRSALTPAPTLATGRGSAAEFSDVQLEDAIAQADSRIDSYIGARYVTPVSPLVPIATPPVYPNVIVYLSRDLAGYLATLTYRGNQDMSDNNPVYRRFADAMQLLMAVAKGQASLDIPGNIGDDSSQGAGDPINPYQGDLFHIRDFDLRPSRLAWDRTSRYGH